MTNQFIFYCIFRYFCTLIFLRSQLVYDNVLFTLLNITDNSVVINKLRQDKCCQALDVQDGVSGNSGTPDIMFICCMVDYGIHAYIEAVK